MPLQDWLPVPSSWIEPDNGLTSAQERETHRAYDETVRRLRKGPGGKKAAQAFIDQQAELYKTWRKNALRRRDG